MGRLLITISNSLILYRTIEVCFLLSFVNFYFCGTFPLVYIFQFIDIKLFITVPYYLSDLCNGGPIFVPNILYLSSFLSLTGVFFNFISSFKEAVISFVYQTMYFIFVFSFIKSCSYLYYFLPSTFFGSFLYLFL